MKGKKWDGVDWSLPDRVIALQVGVSRQAVHVHRQRYGHRRSEEWQLEWVGRVTDWSLPTKELARLVGKSASTISEYRRKHGIPRPPASRYKSVSWRVPWGEVDFGLSNRQIARMYGVHPNSVLVFRRTHGIPNFRAVLRLRWLYGDTCWVK